MFWMRVRRKQLHTLDHRLRLVIEEPVLTGFKAGNNRMSCCRRMLGCMWLGELSQHPTCPILHTGGDEATNHSVTQAFHTPIATRIRSRVNCRATFFIFDFP